MTDGRHVVFRAASGGTLLCDGITDANGYVSCSLSDLERLLGTAQGLGYRAVHICDDFRVAVKAPAVQVGPLDLL